MTTQNNTEPSFWDRLLGGFFSHNGKDEQSQTSSPTVVNGSTAPLNQSSPQTQSLPTTSPQNAPVCEVTELSQCARILCMTDRQTPPCEQVLDQPFLEDAINVRANGQRIALNQIRDVLLDTTLGKEQCFAAKAHRDAIQLIPTFTSIGNYQFLAGVLRDVVIEQNNISSSGQLQGVFASDGLFQNITIRNNIIATRSEHKITINGFLSGCIENNRDGEGELLRVYLGPLRLGGNLGTGNVWVTSFAADDEYQYAPLSSIIPATDQQAGANPYPHVFDERGVAQNRSGKIGDTNLNQFPLSKFKQALLSVSIADLQSMQKSDANNLVAWAGRLLGMVPETHIKGIIEAYEAERSIPIGFIKNQGLRNYFIQMLAKAMLST